MPHGRPKDRRVERTERLLRDALASLIHERPYDDLTVKAILARANVGRSTFYAHFRDKDELLASCMRDMLGSTGAHRDAGPAGRRDRVHDLLGFSLPVLEFHERHRSAGAARMGSETRALLHERLQNLLATRIAADLRRDRRGHASASTVPADLLARHVASTFGVVLSWWIEGGDALTPRDVDARFRALIAPALDAASA